MTSWQRARWEFRAWLCEVLIGWSNRVRPDGYVSSTVKATAKLVLAMKARHHESR